MQTDIFKEYDPNAQSIVSEDTFFFQDIEALSKKWYGKKEEAYISFMLSQLKVLMNEFPLLKDFAVEETIHEREKFGKQYVRREFFKKEVA